MIYNNYNTSNCEKIDAINTTNKMLTMTKVKSNQNDYIKQYL